MFVGREDDLAQLSGLWDKRVASLVTCRGRRRVGKSTLIEEFAKRTAEHFIVIEGLAPRKGMTDERQRRNFCQRLAEQTGGEFRDAASWPLAFSQLDGAIPEKGRTVVLLDEVRELPLREAIQVIGPATDRMSSTEKLDILSVVGGVPRYLEEVRPSLTVDENIRRMCFLRQGLLFREFDETFSAVFGTSAGRRREVLETLAHGAMTASDIAEKLGGEVNGHLTRTLQELEYAGFVAKESNLNAVTGKPARIDRYRICDNYVRFYLHFIEPNRAAIDSGLFRFASMEQLKGWNSQLGYQFENLVVNHVGDLLEHLGIERSLVLSAAPYVQRGTKRGEGCQIDLLVQTHRTVFVVEIKRRREIGPEVMDEVAEKVRRLKVARGVSVRTALVYDGHLSPRIEAEHGFDVVIPADRLL